MYLADEAKQAAEQAHHRTIQTYDDECIQHTYRKRVSRDRFRTLVTRIRRNGTPYGAHTLVHREDGNLLLVRHDGVGLWVLPGGGVDGSESFRETAERELDEEAGIEATYRGLAMLNRVEISCSGYTTWGLLPVFRAIAKTTATTVSDPDDEITAARWFDPAHVPEDTRIETTLLRLHGPFRRDRSVRADRMEPTTRRLPERRHPFDGVQLERSRRRIQIARTRRTYRQPPPRESGYRSRRRPRTVRY